VVTSVGANWVQAVVGFGLALLVHDFYRLAIFIRLQNLELNLDTCRVFLLRDAGALALAFSRTVLERSGRFWLSLLSLLIVIVRLKIYLVFLFLRRFFLKVYFKVDLVHVYYSLVSTSVAGNFRRDFSFNPLLDNYLDSVRNALYHLEVFNGGRNKLLCQLAYLVY